MYDADVWIDKVSFGGSANVDDPFYLVVDNSDRFSDVLNFNGGRPASPPKLSSLRVLYNVSLTTFPTPVRADQCNERYLHNSFRQIEFINTTSRNYYLYWSNLCYRRDTTPGFLDNATLGLNCVDQFFIDPIYQPNIYKGFETGKYESRGLVCLFLTRSD